MDDAHAAIAKDAPHGHLIVADAQSAGRGARGRTWVGRPGAHLMFSLVLRQVPTDGLTLAAGVAIARAIEQFAPEDVRIKWPNDVWMGQPPRKVAGILVEARSSGPIDALVLGVGLNIGREDWPAELQATSLSNYVDVTRDACLEAVLRTLEEAIDALARGGLPALLPEVRKRLLWRGERVRCEETVGTLLDVNDEGSLEVETDDGVQTLRAGHLRQYQ